MAKIDSFVRHRLKTNGRNSRYGQTWNPSRLVYCVIKMDENLIPSSTAALKQCFHLTNNNTRHSQTAALHTRVFGPANKKQSFFSALMEWRNVFFFTGKWEKLLTEKPTNLMKNQDVAVHSTHNEKSIATHSHLSRVNDAPCSLHDWPCRVCEERR